jgi:hypothetical protein
VLRRPDAELEVVPPTAKHVHDASGFHMLRIGGFLEGQELVARAGPFHAPGRRRPKFVSLSFKHRRRATAIPNTG